jgi:hypothetical protein
MVCGDWWVCARWNAGGNRRAIGPITNASTWLQGARCGHHSAGASGQNRRAGIVQADLALVPARRAVILLAP